MNGFVYIVLFVAAGLFLLFAATKYCDRRIESELAHAKALGYITETETQKAVRLADADREAVARSIGMVDTRLAAHTAEFCNRAESASQPLAPVLSFPSQRQAGEFS